MRRTVALLVLVVLTVACGTKPAARATYRTTEKQVAAIEARDASPLRQSIAHEVSCLASDVSCAIFAQYLLDRWGKIAAEARTLSNDLDNAEPVAPETRGLTRDTIAAADLVNTSYSAFDNCAMSHHGIEPCRSEEDAAEAAWRALPATLDGWKPYGGA